MSTISRSTIRRSLTAMVITAASAALIGCGGSSSKDDENAITINRQPQTTTTQTTPPDTNTSSAAPDPTNEQRPKGAYELPNRFPGSEPVHISYNPFVLGSGSASSELTQ